MSTVMYPYGLIGNCQISALVSSLGSIDWLCLPRPDSEPIFGHLLDPDGGHFSISTPEVDAHKSRQYYLDNTNILVTEVVTTRGDSFRITDFCPRFEQYGRNYRPSMIFRIVEPLSGSPIVQVSCQPVTGWGKEPVRATRGNSHLKYEVRDDILRLTTNMPLTYLCEGSAFPLKEKLYFALTWSSPLEDDLIHVSETFLRQTRLYWRTWVKHCSIPSLFQKETIRSALALKLHCYEDTGAILAALTTSLPEEVGKGRNWDYRYCWLRDTHFVLSAFHNLGHFEEIEGFLKYFLGIAQQSDRTLEGLAPVYTLSQALPVPELQHPTWAGYSNSIPVRTFNQAAEHIQNDVYGEMLLTLAPIYFDERFVHLRDEAHADLMIHLGRLCERSLNEADAGLWELRNGWQEHTFTKLMSWAGLERLSRVARQHSLDLSSFDISRAVSAAQAAVEACVHEGSLRNGPHDATFDGSLLLAPVFRYPNRDLCTQTVDTVAKNLRLGEDPSSQAFFYRYKRADDFGTPSSAFLICSFWMVQALVKLGRKDQALAMLRQVQDAANHVGLFSEHYLPSKKMQLGNFPQAYSHVGMINAAFAVSPPWEDVL